MLTALLDFALGRRLFIIMLALALCAAGVWAFLHLKLEAYPDISDTGVVVITTYPGFAAEEVEQQVTIPIERALNNVPRVIARRSRNMRVTVDGALSFGVTAKDLILALIGTIGTAGGTGHVIEYAGSAIRSLSKWNVRVLGARSSASATAPAGIPSGPACTSSRNTSRRFSWARADKAETAVFDSIFR